MERNPLHRELCSGADKSGGDTKAFCEQFCSCFFGNIDAGSDEVKVLEMITITSLDKIGHLNRPLVKKAAVNGFAERHNSEFIIARAINQNLHVPFIAGQFI